MTGPLEVLPVELDAAAGPLRAAARSLRAITDDRLGMRALLDGIPSADLRAAAQRALEAYELVAWEYAQEAEQLAQRLSWAGAQYVERDRGIASSMPR